jgi:cytosol alanyl aminopeptidase
VIRGRLPIVALVCGACAIVGCRQPPAPAAAPPVGSPAAGARSAEAPAAADDGRLPKTATPLHYALALSIDPDKPRFSGVATIDVDLALPTAQIVVNARDMNISRAVARVGHGAALDASAGNSAGGRATGGDSTVGEAIFPAKITARVAHGGVVAEELVLAFSPPLPAGPASIEIVYDAPFAPDLAGLYRVEEAGRAYAYSQFEVADARRAFPCFDEPSYKTPYDVTVSAPPGAMALTNSPEVSVEPAPDGSVIHRFATSPPLPSYLVAFAVGDFDAVEWRKEPFPIRAITTKGRGSMSGLALDAADALVGRLGDYFDMPYPYAKLDLVAVPDFAAGAMENPGLVTFRDSLLLLDATRATAASRRRQATVIAHELAHQWFGDLVTMEWWDDIWLNEGFATWAEAKVLDAWKPTSGATLEQIAGAQHVMDTDALRSARAVREPVRSKGDAEEAFDGITYEKGAAVLRMIEGWLGPDVFRRGIQRYLRQYAWKNARATDLFGALDFVSTQKVGELAGGFLDQPGVPEVVVGWSCGGPGGTKLTLSESEWRPVGGGGERHQTWTLPVCITADGQNGKSCFTLGPDLIARGLGPTCPSWMHPNAGESGYYRFVLGGARLSALARGARGLSAAERLGVVSNIWAEVRQGAVPVSVLFDLLPSFDAETSRQVVEQVAGIIQAVDVTFVDDTTRAAFRRWVSARMSARKGALGWEPAPREDDERTLERPTVLWVMAELAGDDATLEQAEQYADRWLRDPGSVPSDTAASAVTLASMRAGAARLYQLRSAAAHAKTPEDRVLAIRAMGMFDDPDVLRSAFDLTLTSELRLSELRYVFGSALGHRPARAVLFAWEKDNWDKLRARMSGFAGRGIFVDVVGTMCSPADRDDAAVFFGRATQGMEGIKRRLDQNLESASLCISLRDYGAADAAHSLQQKFPDAR